LDNKARLSPISRIVTKLVDNNNITEVKSAGRNKVSVSFNNYKKANNFVQFDALQAYQLKTSIPAFRVRSDIIKNVSLDISEETVCKEFTSAAKIISARRLPQGA